MTIDPTEFGQRRGFLDMQFVAGQQLVLESAFLAAPGIQPKHQRYWPGRWGVVALLAATRDQSFTGRRVLGAGCRPNRRGLPQLT